MSHDSSVYKDFLKICTQTNKALTHSKSHSGKNLAHRKLPKIKMAAKYLKGLYRKNYDFNNSIQAKEQNNFIIDNCMCIPNFIEI